MHAPISTHSDPLMGIESTFINILSACNHKKISQVFIAKIIRENKVN